MRSLFIFILVSTFLSCGQRGADKKEDTTQVDSLTDKNEVDAEVFKEDRLYTKPLTIEGVCDRGLKIGDSNPLFSCAPTLLLKKSADVTLSMGDGIILAKYELISESELIIKNEFEEKVYEINNDTLIDEEKDVWILNYQILKEAPGDLESNEFAMIKDCVDYDFLQKNIAECSDIFNKAALECDSKENSSQKCNDYNTFEFVIRNNLSRAGISPRLISNEDQHKKNNSIYLNSISDDSSSLISNDEAIDLRDMILDLEKRDLEQINSILESSELPKVMKEQKDLKINSVNSFGFSSSSLIGISFEDENHQYCLPCEIGHNNFKLGIFPK